MTRFFVHYAALPAVLLLLSVTRVADAQTAPFTTAGVFFPKNAVIKSAVRGNATVGFANEVDVNNMTIPEM